MLHQMGLLFAATCCCPSKSVTLQCYDMHMKWIRPRKGPPHETRLSAETRGSCRTRSRNSSHFRCCCWLLSDTDNRNASNWPAMATWTNMPFWWCSLLAILLFHWLFFCCCCCCCYSLCVFQPLRYLCSCRRTVASLKQPPQYRIQYLLRWVTSVCSDVMILPKTTPKAVFMEHIIVSKELSFIQSGESICFFFFLNFFFFLRIYLFFRFQTANLL